MKVGIDHSLLWYVIRTKVRAEDKAYRNLLRAGYRDIYYPRFRAERYNKRTKVFRTAEYPLLVGYLFVGQPKKDADWYSITGCDGVADVLSNDGTYIPVNSRVIEALLIQEIDMQFDETRAARIHRKEEAKSLKKTVEMRFPIGTTVSVTEGPFEGLIGIVREAKGGRVKLRTNLPGDASFDPKHLKPAA